MPIEFQHNVFHLYNQNISYCIVLSEKKDLLHGYFGARIDGTQIMMKRRERSSFSAVEEGETDYSLDVLPQEYPTFGCTDMRTPALEAELVNGNRMLRLSYYAHQIKRGKPEIPGLPAVYAQEDEAQTLILFLKDPSGLEAVLYYTIFEHYDAVCRHSEIRNQTGAPIFLNAVYSASIDFFDSEFRYLHLHGAWAREKHIELAPVKKGFQGIDSKRGASGSAENPFMAFLRRDAGEDFGEVYGFSLVYSGNFKMQAEVEQYGTMRFLAGINPHQFRWKLKNQEVFATPELVMVYSGAGLGQMSRIFHRLYRERLCKGIYRDQERPILINNWEATYFDFNEKKLLDLSRAAAGLGIELFVLDDGWFGERNDDKSSLGDWFVNLQKLPSGLKGLAGNIHKTGLKFGLWLEPEMVSPRSKLFADHPEWVIHAPGRAIHPARNQYILDLGREDVRNYLITVLTQVLKSADIQYVKWDMNRNMTDIYSCALAPERQGEVAHRYILGVYALMDALTRAFPEILFEGCSGGAGRNDPGILYYMPQNWGSDDTDAVERMYIQYGASMVYPASTVCAHVSAVPNHQTGRSTPLKLRGAVAMSANFGYELDLSKLNDMEKEEIKEQIKQYKRIRKTIMFGDLYRLMNPFEERGCAWMYVSQDKTKCVVFYFNKLCRPNAELRRLKLKGLHENKVYIVKGKEYSGRNLMRYGLYLPLYEKDFESEIWEIEEKR